jgi:FAD/FMN-containing dehydrogenase
LSQAVLDTKQRFDPLGLLNPGKVRAWMKQPLEIPA